MPCMCDYLEPSQREKEASKVLALLHEIKTGTPPDPKTYGNGMWQGNYANPGQADILTATLCTTLKTRAVEQYSLEMQLWWRYHQEADRAREQRRVQEMEKQFLKENALKKLTREEREALGL